MESNLVTSQETKSDLVSSERTKSDLISSAGTESDLVSFEGSDPKFVNHSLDPRLMGNSFKKCMKNIMKVGNIYILCNKVDRDDYWRLENIVQFTMYIYLLLHVLLKFSLAITNTFINYVVESR